MGSGLKEHWKLVVLGIALITAVGTIVTKTLEDPSSTGGPTQSQHLVDTKLGEAPVPAWTLDVARLTDNTGDVLLAMPQTLNSYYGYGGLFDAGNLLIAATAYPLPAAEGQSGRPVGAVTLVGIDPADGSAKWRTRVGNVGQCGQETGQPVIACWENRRIAFVDLTSGALLSEIGTDFDLNGAQVDGNTIYVSGSVSDGGSAKSVLTSGTVTDITANFRRTFDVRGERGTAYARPASGTIIAYERGLPGGPPYIYTVYDLETGDRRFAFEGDSLQEVGEGLYLTSTGARSGTVGTQNLLAADGSVIRAVPIPMYVPQDPPGKPSTSAPLFLGDGAYDPKTGAELWRNPALVNEGSVQRSSTLSAVVGRTVVVSSADTRTITGLDLESGRQLWQTPWQDAYWIRGGATDGKYFVFSDYTGTHSIRASDGKIMWSVPLPEGADPREVVVSDAAGTLMVSWRDHFTFWK
ncbi:PQQ-binding-like beta-propeller repeat protein [Prescottella agglutinans]|uniref:Outer membrane protein assembly factor BamB n=1 Tax=Prescottella agglutinans TaxID=1644129 RepID=A0ABT6M8X0_9NOCA|nr:PQQ-binding-like beta-propeller repeat protein [Prescottella agglutinans]MDH6280758.1 outer membrane protein assembly factor BamB [Prescottella agglutinans]